MKEIEIGEYVKTKDGIIAQIKSIDYEAGIYRFDRIIYNNDFGMKEDVLYNNEMFKKVIVKHSKQLMDLIEVGDYINGYKVINIIKNKINNNKLIAVGNMDYEFETVKELTETNGIKLLGNKDIQTILTRESYMANCYKVGGE